MATGLFTLLLLLTRGAAGLRDVVITVPDAVSLGSSTTLGCRWLLDPGEQLYTVKWYRGAQEFFRYVPKELPHTRVFVQRGIDVDVGKSGGQQVTLRDATRALGGRYRCEVSADAPFFHTVYKTAYMHVVELPETAPAIVAHKSWYSAGDTLRANCTSGAASPAANITWLLNGNEVKGYSIPPNELVTKSSYDTSLQDINSIIFSPWNTLSGYEEPVTDNVIDIPALATYNSSRNWSLNSDIRTKKDVKLDSKYEPKYNDKTKSQSKDSIKEFIKKVFPNVSVEVNATDAEDKSNKSSSRSQLVLKVQSHHFKKGRLNLTCVAKVYSIYSAKAELIVEEERPQIAPVMGSRDTNAGRRSHGVSVLERLGVAFAVSFSIRSSAWR